MALVTTFERYAFKEGEASGYQKGEINSYQNILMHQIKIKFKKIPENYIEKIHQADQNLLDKWLSNFVFANSLEEVFN